MNIPHTPPDAVPPGAGSLDPALLQARLRLRTEVEIGHNPAKPGGTSVVEDRLRGKFFEIGNRERNIIEQFDGTRTVAEIASGLPAGGADPAELQAQNVQTVLSIAQWLIQQNLAVIADGDNTTRLLNQFRVMENQRTLALINVLCVKFTLLNPSHLLEKSRGLAQILFHPLCALAWCVLALVALGVCVGRWDEIAGGYAGILSGYRWVWLLLAWVGLKVVHESGHALACYRYGGRVTQAGVLLLLFTPMAWVDVSSCWKFNSRWQRIVVSFAGMYFELAIAFAAIIAWSMLPASSAVRDICFNVFLMASVTTVLFNANPLMRFDGYFMLTDSINIVNLYTKGQMWVRSLWSRIFFGIALPTGSPQSNAGPTERAMVPVYGILAAVWRLLIGVSLIIAASAMFYGAGILLALVAGVCWYGVPVAKSMTKMIAAAQSDSVNWRRFGTSLTVVLAVIAGCGWLLQSPATQSAPAVVRLKDERVMRAVQDGFVVNVCVRDGQAVVAGQPLVVLNNDELLLTVRKLEFELEASRTTARSLLERRELSRWQSEIDNQTKLQAQLLEHRTTLDQLTIRAPFDGIVFCREIDSLPGRYIPQGQPVLTLARNNSLEIVASLDQDNSSAIARVSANPVKAVFSGVPVTLCNVSAIRPRADIHPAHPALCVPAGGPLAVRPKAQNSEDGGQRESEFELLSPRFNIELQIPPAASSQLAPGQTGRVIFASQRHSLGVWGWISLTDWIRSKFRLATSAR